MSARNSVQNLSREDWLEKALNVVSRVGGAKLRINNLVTEVGVTKGSFYWHFKDREDFVRSLIDHWHQRYTLTVSDYLDDFDEDDDFDDEEFDPSMEPEFSEDDFSAALIIDDEDMINDDGFDIEEFDSEEDSLYEDEFYEDKFYSEEDYYNYEDDDEDSYEDSYNL